MLKTVADIGVKPVNIDHEKRRLHDVHDEVFWTFLKRCIPYTLLSTEKLYNLYEATVYLCKRKVSGNFVECGVFLGGAVMMMAQTLAHLGVVEKIYLYDTFAGFTKPPTEHDVNFKGGEIGTHRSRSFRAQTESNVHLIDYPTDQYVVVEGDISETLLHTAPERIALLRLDTDTYETTRDERIHLYPRIVPGGILIIDDYGYSEGARKAVDEYFLETASPLFFQRPNWSSRTAVKF